MKRVIREVFRDTINYFREPVTLIFKIESDPGKLSYQELRTLIIDKFIIYENENF